MLNKFTCSVYLKAWITRCPIQDDGFAYFVATVCKEERGMKDLKNRISKARGAFVRLKVLL